MYSLTSVPSLLPLPRSGESLRYCCFRREAFCCWKSQRCTPRRYLQINKNPFNLLFICNLIHVSSSLISFSPHGSVWWRLRWRTASLFQKSSSDDGALPSAAGDVATLPKSRNRPVRKGRVKQDCPEQPNSATDVGDRSHLETVHNGKLSNLQELLL